MMINIVDLYSAVPGNHLIGWETQTVLVPLPNVFVVDGWEDIDVPQT